MTVQQECSQFLLVETGSTTFSTYIVGDHGEYGRFAMTLNDNIICSTYPDHSHNGASNYAPGSCSAVVDVVAGDVSESIFDDILIYLISRNLLK